MGCLNCKTKGSDHCEGFLANQMQMARNLSKNYRDPQSDLLMAAVLPADDQHCETELELIEMPWGHSLAQQLSGWLLMRPDRAQGNELRMTQERISNVPGVRREAVTENALKLQEQSLIRHSRSHLVVLDHNGLEELVGECSAVVKREYDRLLPDKMAV